MHLKELTVRVSLNPYPVNVAERSHISVTLVTIVQINATVERGCQPPARVQLIYRPNIPLFRPSDFWHPFVEAQHASGARPGFSYLSHSKLNAGERASFVLTNQRERPLPAAA